MRASRLVDESKGRHAEVRFSCETSRARLWGLHKRQGGRVGSEKRGGIASRHGSQKIEKLLTGANRKSVGRMAHDVGVNVIPQVETDRQSSRVRVRDVVGYLG